MAITIQVDCLPFYLFGLGDDPYGKKCVAFYSANNVFVIKESFVE
jgi:hypothetical protein